MRTGWVLRNKYDGTFMDNDYMTGEPKLSNALIFSSRAEARLDRLPEETVLKVSLTKNGKAEKIIGRG